MDLKSGVLGSQMYGEQRVTKRNLDSDEVDSKRIKRYIQNIDVF